MAIASTISFAIGGELGIAWTEKFCRRLEGAGLRGVWYSENNVSEAFTQIAAVCRSTTTLRFGTAVAGIYGRSPLIMGMSAASLANISTGRFVLGLGAQTRKSIELWYGGSSFDPQQTMIEYVQVVRGLLEGRKVTYKGRYVKADNLEIVSRPKFPTKIFVAAIGPRMIETAGEVADGVIGAFWSPEYVREVVIPSLKKGAEKSGRRVSDLEIVCTHECLPTENFERDFEAIKPHILMVATVPFFEGIFVQGGFEKELASIKLKMATGDIDGAFGVVSEEMVRKLEIVGDKDSIRTQVNEFLRAGLTELVVHPNVGNTFHPLHPKHLPDAVSNFARRPLYSEAKVYDKVISSLS